MRFADEQSRSTFAWLRLSVRGDGRRDVVAWDVKEIGDRVVNGDELLEMSG